METKISRTYVPALIGLLLSFNLYAGEEIPGGGATEMTQLANNGELIAQVGEAVQTTANTLATAEATMNQLRQLDPGSIAAMVGLPISTVQKMADAYKVFSKAAGVYQQASGVLQKAQYDAKNLNVTPSALLNMKAQTAYAYGGQYKSSYDSEMAKLAQLDETSKQVQKSADSLGGINSTVKGVQTLAGQNLQMQSQLVSINQSISAANALAAQQAMEAKNAEGRRAEVDAVNAESGAENSAEAMRAISGIDTSDVVRRSGGKR